ncbi:hotdog fold thioesterase [Litchfieldia alkalitelluris]|uniref:hotdog fold thioesterase n=1 Tax=Litchfieldia alkalitelluris TaxID=304268 RepID=UPI0009960913
MVKMEASFKNTLINALGIKIIELSEERAVASMPVDERTRQPYGVLHGGASVALAETIASIGTYNLLDQEKEYCVGLEINANHIKSKKDGIVKAVATPLHKGRKTMVWDIKIIDEKAQLICVSRCTMAILPIQQ